MEEHRRSRRGSSRSSSIGTTQPQASTSVCIPKLTTRRRSGVGTAVEFKVENSYNSDHDDYPDSSSNLISNMKHSPSPHKRKKKLIKENGDHIQKRNRREVTEKLTDLLECPVCLDIPRSAPIFSCRNGHLICAKCQPKLECCPICRSPDVGCRNGFAEKFAIPLLDEVTLSCINQTFGCQHRDLGKHLSIHAPDCLHEQVYCPASNRKACTWHGSLISVVDHAWENKCAQLLRVTEDQLFRCSIGDFNDTNFTVFERTATTYWKPVFLLAKSLKRYYLYLVILRTGNGFWYIYIRSLAHNHHSKDLQVRVQLFEATVIDETSGIALTTSESSGTSNPSNSPVFTYTGNVMSATCSEEDVMMSGNYLFLRDDQIKFLKRGKRLFEYSISVDVRRKLDPDCET